LSNTTFTEQYAKAGPTSGPAFFRFYGGRTRHKQRRNLEAQTEDTAMSTMQQTTEDKRFYRVPDLMRRWSLGRSTIYGLMDAGKLRSVRIGTARRIPIESVHEFEAELGATPCK
jgi:excisionase family DNA binding protein